MPHEVLKLKRANLEKQRSQKNDRGGADDWFVTKVAGEYIYISIYVKIYIQEYTQGIWVEIQEWQGPCYSDCRIKSKSLPFGRFMINHSPTQFAENAFWNQYKMTIKSVIPLILRLKHHLAICSFYGRCKGQNFWKDTLKADSVFRKRIYFIKVGIKTSQSKGRVTHFRLSGFSEKGFMWSETKFSGTSPYWDDRGPMFPPTRNSFSRVSRLSFVLDLAKEHASLSNHLDKQSDPFVTKAHMFPMFVFQILDFSQNICF